MSEVLSFSNLLWKEKQAESSFSIGRFLATDHIKVSSRHLLSDDSTIMQLLMGKQPKTLQTILLFINKQHRIIIYL